MELKQQQHHRQHQQHSLDVHKSQFCSRLRHLHKRNSAAQNWRIIRNAPTGMCVNVIYGFLPFFIFLGSFLIVLTLHMTRQNLFPNIVSSFFHFGQAVLCHYNQETVGKLLRHWDLSAFTVNLVWRKFWITSNIEINESRFFKNLDCSRSVYK